MFSWRVHLAHAGRWRIGLLQRLEDRIGRYMRLLAFLCFALPVLDRFSPPWLIFVVRVILLVLHSQSLRFFHKRSLLYFVEQSGGETEDCTSVLKYIQPRAEKRLIYFFKRCEIYRITALTVSLLIMGKKRLEKGVYHSTTALRSVSKTPIPHPIERGNNRKKVHFEELLFKFKRSQALPEPAGRWCISSNK